MGTVRYYFPRSSAPAAAVTPAADAFWNAFGTEQPLKELATTKYLGSSGEVLASSVTNPPGGLIRNILIATYVGAALPTRLIEGSFQFVTGFFGTTSGNVMSQLRVRVVNSAGVTRGVLYAGQTAGGTSVVSTDPNYAINTGTGVNNAISRILSGAFTPLNVLAGDRLVVEIGVRQCTPNGGSRYGGTLIGAVSDGTTDFDYAVDQVGGENGWIEITMPDIDWAFVGNDQVAGLYVGPSAASHMYLGANQVF